MISSSLFVKFQDKTRSGSPATGLEGPEREWRFYSTFSLNSPLGGVGTPSSGPFTLGKETPYTCIGGWLAPKFVLDALNGIRSSDRPG